jgi:hypothetical protein
MGANNGPTVPSIGTPPIAPDMGTPGSFSQKFFGALNKPANGLPLMPALIKAGVDAMNPEKQSTIDAALKTGPWAAATSNADATQPTQAPLQAPRRSPAEGILAAIGDISAAPGEGGFWGGFSRTAKATTERRREEMNDREHLATANAQMLHEQQLSHKLGEDQLAAATVSGKEGLNAIMTAERPGSLVAEGLTSDQVAAKIKQGEIDPTKQTVFLTGRIPVGKDANGQPLFRSTYTIVEPAGDIKLSDKQADFIKSETGREIPAGTELPSVQFNSLWQQAQSAQTTNAARDLALAKNSLEVHKAQVGKDAEGMARIPIVTNAINGHTASPEDPYATVKAFDAIMNNPKLLNDPSMPANFAEAYARWAGGDDTGANFGKLREKYAEAQAKNADTVGTMINDYMEHPDKISGHTPAVIAAADAILKDPTKAGTKQYLDAQRLKDQAQATQKFELDQEGAKEITKDEAKLKAQQRASAVANPQGLTGEAFIRTLPVGRAATLRAFGTGAMVVNPSALERTDKGQAFLDDIYTAYPDLDTSKAPAYAKMRTNFSTGKEAQGINASNTVLHHLDRMNTNLDTATAGITGSMEQFIGTNEAGRRLADDSKAVSGELGKLYSGGVVTEGEMRDWEEKLNPKGFGMTVNKLRTNVKEFAQLLGGKLEAFQDQWDDGVPSQYLSAPKSLASVDSQAAYKKITGKDLKVHPTQQISGIEQKQPALPNQPANTIHMQKPDGTYIFVPSNKVQDAINLGAKVVGQ